MNITKVTIESMEVGGSIVAEGEGAFAVVKNSEGTQFLLDGKMGPELLAAAVSEATRVLMAIAGPAGKAIAAAAVLEALGNKGAADETAYKVAANHEAAIAMRGDGS